MIYFKIFQCCYIVNGKNRSILHDTQRQESIIISHDMSNIIDLLSMGISIKKLKERYDKQDHKIIDEYLDFFISKEFGFYCDKFDFSRFPEISKIYQTPFELTNAIIESKKFETDYIYDLMFQLSNFKIKYISLLIYNTIENKLIIDIIEKISLFGFLSVELTSKFHHHINDELFLKLNYNNPLTKLVFYSSPEDKIFKWDNEIFFDRIFTIKEINSFKNCGIIDIKYFNTNSVKIHESLNHNSCLHKKISIDINGNIKNCPSMPQSFGNIKDTTLEEATNHPEFKKYWNITKDQIEVCKDCEFRHICTDCRAFLEKPDNILSKPLKCGYNPYTNEWAEWSTNPLKQKAIEYYGMQELIKKDV